MMTIQDFVAEFDKLRPDVHKHPYTAALGEGVFYGPRRGWGANVYLRDGVFLVTFSKDTQDHVFEIGRFCSPRDAAKSLLNCVTKEGF